MFVEARLAPDEGRGETVSADELLLASELDEPTTVVGSEEDELEADETASDEEEDASELELSADDEETSVVEEDELLRTGEPPRLRSWIQMRNCLMTMMKTLRLPRLKLN